MITPKISIIVPIYGVEKYIERCVRSLFEQTLSDIEYIFVNDCTPDKSIEILKKVIREYPNRKETIKLITLSCNKGVAYARNVGLANSTGDYIGWVDPDDWVEKDMFQLLYNQAVEFNAELVWCDYTENTPDKERLVSQKAVEHSRDLLRCIIIDDFLPLSTKIIKRDLFLHNKIRFIDGANMSEDRNVCIKVLGVTTKIKYLSRGLYHYNISNNASLMHIFNRKRISDYVVNMIDAVKFLSNTTVEWLSEEDLMEYKLLAKNQYLMSLDLKSLMRWSLYFPEVNNNANIRCLPLNNRILAYLAMHHQWCLLRIVLKLYKTKLKLVG